MSDSKHERGRVWIVEDVEESDFGRYSGLFAAHWESAKDDRSLEGPEGVPVEEAIAWGRRHSDVVLVRVGSDTHYSAGTTYVQEDGAKPWPEDGLTVRPRPEGAPVDGSEQVVDWPTRVTLAPSLKQPADVVRLIEPSAVSVDLIDSSNDEETVLRIGIRARGSRAATVAIHRLVTDALSEVGLADQVRVRVQVRLPN